MSASSRVVTRALAAVLLCLGCACEGPTLWVGELLPTDAGGLDAESDQPAEDAQGGRPLDAAPADVMRDARPPRDQRDARVVVIVPTVCRDERDCPGRWPYCLEKIGYCVECRDDRDCRSRRCDETWFFCHEDDREGPGGEQDSAP